MRSQCNMLAWQAAIIAISAYLHCEAEPGDASAMALLATLRKRLVCVRASASCVARALQVVILV